MHFSYPTGCYPQPELNKNLIIYIKEIIESVSDILSLYDKFQDIIEQIS